MPKISSSGMPSYEGHTGLVTNAVGEQFEVNSSLNLDGEHSDDYVNEPVGEFEETPASGLPGPIVPVEDEDPDTGDNEDGKTDGDEWDPATPKPAGNQTPAFLPEKSTPAKKTAAAKK